MRIAAIIALAAALPAQTDDLAAKSRAAKQAMNEGRFAEAVQLYTELTRALPDNPGLRMNLGLALHSAGRFRPAIEQFHAVLKTQPNLAPAHLLLGLAHLKLGEPARAVAPLARVLDLDPENKIALLELGDAQLSLGRPERAAPHFEKLTRLDPSNAKGWHGLGLSHGALSRRAFDRLEKTAPQSVWWYMLLAQSKAEQEQFRTAFYLYRKALEAGPDVPGIHGALAGIYRKTGHADWAEIEELRELQVAKPGPRPPAPYQEAVAHSRQSLEAFARLGQLPPTPEIHELLAEAHRIQGRHKESIRELEAALRLAPKSLRLRQEHARSLWLNRDYDAALPALEKLLAANPRSPENSHRLGDTLLELQQFEKAVPHLERAVQLKPDFAEAHASLGRAYMRLGSFEKAVPHLKAALPMDEDGSLHFQLARALERSGKSDEAAQAMAGFQEITKAVEARKEGLDRERQITAP